MEQAVSFGRHRFDLATGRLWSGRREVRLTPKAAAVLKALVTHAGHPVRKEELFASVWNGIVVSDDALTSCIQELRRALADDARHPRFIETRHRCGYRFVARVSDAGAKDAADSRLPTHDGAGTSTPPTAVLTRPAVAILPFANLSGDPEQEYFAAGISEDLISALSHWRWLPVIAGNSTFAYKGGATEVTQIGRELNARYVLQGSVRRAKDRLRVATQLIDAGNGHCLWAQTYDRRLGDLFELQDEITGAIVGAVEPRLSDAEQRRAVRKRPENLDAWDRSLRALWHLRRATQQDLAAAERLLTEAVGIDPTASYARSLIALCRWLDALSSWTRDPPGALASTHAAAREAVALDETDWLAHALLGIAVLWTQRDYDRAIEELETALALNPSSSLSHQLAGCVRGFAGEAAAAIPHLEAAMRLDPRYQSPASVLSDLGLAYFLVDQPGEALIRFDRAIADRPDYVRAWQRRAACLGCMGRTGEAKAAFARVLKLQPGFSPVYVESTYPFRDPAQAEMFTEGLRKAGWHG